MPDKKIIAVIGATGAQGGGLVRAILADTPGALRRAGDHPQARFRTRRGRSPRSASRSWPATPTTRRASTAPSPAPTAPSASRTSGSTSRPSARARRRRRWRAPRARPASQHVVWSTLEDTRKRVPARRPAAADAARQVQGAALRFQGRGGRVFADEAAPTTLPAGRVLLGQLHLLRHGSAQGRRRQPRARAAARRRQAAGHRGRGHRQVRLRHLPARHRTVGQRFGIAGEVALRPGDGGEDGRAPSGAPVASTTCRSTSTAASAFPAPTTSATCSSSRPFSARSSCAAATPSARAR